MPGPTRVRYRRIRVADKLDDQQSAAAIVGALASSMTEEDLQVFFLSRLREVIFGPPGAGPVQHWYDDFAAQGILPLISVGKRKTGVGLVGPQDGSNRTFVTPDKFVRANSLSIDVFHNGRRLVEAPSPDVRLGDFFCTESLGPGTGYDTVNLLGFSPVGRSVLVSDYQVAP